MIKINSISKEYVMGENKLLALNNVNVSILEGEFVSIMGSSGSGKSTLMNIIGCLDVPSSGDYFFKDDNISNFNANKLAELRNREIGFIFQTFNLVNRSTVLKNVLTGRLSNISTIRSILGLWPKDQKEMAFEALNQVEILEKAYVRASNLSGGQQQRVGIARALSQKPKVMLADEPVASLDPITSRVVMSYLKKINTELGITTIVNLHFLDLAKEFGDRLIGLRDGKLVFDGNVNDVSDEDFENIYGRSIKSSDLIGDD